jgi:glycerol-3-phosphate acyltransferase PlsY
VGAIAFGAGAIPFSNYAARAVAGVDLRHVGSGTVSGTSLYRVTGFVPLAIAGVADVGKGAVGPLVAGSDRPGLAAVAGGLAVAGHNWSPLLRGAGGRGLSPAIGALLVQVWPAALLLLAGMVAGRLVHETAVGTLVALALLVPFAAIADGRWGAAAGAAVVVPMLAKRALGNRPPEHRSARAYAHRIVYDCDPEDMSHRRERRE